MKIILTSCIILFLSSCSEKENYFQQINRLNNEMNNRFKIVATGENYSIIKVDGREILSNNKGGMMYLKSNGKCRCLKK